MTDRTCRCGRPTRDDAYVCDDCTGHLSVALGDCAWLDQELETTIGRQKANAHTGGSRSAETPLPLHWGAAEARTHLKAVLVSWVLFAHEERIRNASPHPGLPADDLTTLSRWLMWRVDGLALHDIGPEAVDEVTEAVRSCMRYVDRPPEHRYAGPCRVCGRDLYHAPGATVCTCMECGETHDVGERYTWMRDQVRGQLVTASEGAGLLCKFDMETQQGTIDKWHERGQLAAHGTTPKGHRLYLFDDLIEQATRREARRSA